MRSYILTIKDVYLLNMPAVDDMFEAKFTEQLQVQVITTYISLPKKFTSLDQWPRYTNLHCWHCASQFDSVPIFIPRNPSQDQYDTHGVFCTWNCAMAYIETHFHRDSKWDAKQMLYHLHYIFTGQKTHYIAPAPPHTILKQFSGSTGISIGEYREQIAKLTF